MRNSLIINRSLVRDMGTRQEDNVLDLLEKINDRLRRIDRRLDRLSKKQDEMLTSLSLEESSHIEAGEFKDYPLDVVTLLSLPDHLRKTAMVLCKEGEATAEQIAQKTGRVRAVESSYLNQLYTMRHVKKRRKGRDVYFRVER